MSGSNIGYLRRLTMPLVALSLITNFAILVNPIFMMQVLDRVVPTGNLHTLAMLLTVALGALALQAVVEYLRDMSFRRAANWLEQACLPLILQAPKEDRASLIRDRNCVTDALSSQTAVTALAIPWLPLFFLVLWIIHPWFLFLTAGLVAVSSTVHIVSHALLSASQAQHQALLSKESQALRDAETAINGAGMPGVFQNLLDQISKIVLDRLSVAQHMTRPAMISTSLSSFLRGSTQLLALSLGAALVVRAELSAGGMIAASLILSRSVISFEQALTNWPSIREAREAIGRLANATAQPVAATEIPSLSGGLTCQGLISPRGGGAPPRLDRISFEIPPGACLAIVGSSGGGKTTLLEALSGISPCPIGAVLLDETDVKTLPVASLSAHVGFLPQQAQLFHGTLAENICGFAAERVDSNIVLAAKTAGVHGLISALPQSYDTDIGAHPHLLSAGQKQRVALARAIFRNPRYLFLDEPNALLDAAGERQLCAALARLKANGTTTVMVIHRSGLMGLADYVLALEKGRMTDFGTRSDVLDRMTNGRRRIEMPLQASSLQDLADWIGAQFTRSGDADLCKQAETIAAEIFNLALTQGDTNSVRGVSFAFRFLDQTHCEISMTDDHPSTASQKIRRLPPVVLQPETDLSALPKEEASLAAVTRMCDSFDISETEGQAVYRAVVSASAGVENRRVAL